MYMIKYYDDYIYIPGDNDFVAISPILERESNKAGSLTFTILDTHPHFGELRKLKLGFVVEDEKGIPLFKGRAIDSEQGFDNEYTVKVEGKLAVLNDSACRPYEFAGPPEELFDWFINNHNSQVSDEQKLLKGNVTVTDPNDYIVRSWENTTDTWTLVKSRLIDTLGGYLVVRYEEDGDYLDWVKDFSLFSSQKVEFGENLLDLSMFIDASKTYTACIPYGAEIINRTYGEIDPETDTWQEGTYYTLSGTDYLIIDTEQMFNAYISDGTAVYKVTSEENTGQRLTVESVNDGKDYVINEDMAEEYGIIYAPTDDVTWEDVTRPENLYSKATDWLNNYAVMLESSVELSFLDLSKLGIDIDSVDMYQNVYIESSLHNLSVSYLVKKMTLKLDAPEDLQITLGSSERTLTDRTLGEKRKSEDVFSRLGKIESDYESVKFANEKIDSIDAALREEIIEQSSYLLKTAEEITMGILAGYTTVSDLETYKKEIENLFSASEEGFSFEFKQLSEKLTDLGNEISNQQQYIRLINGEIHIGDSNSPVTSVYTNDALEFRYNGNMVARFTNDVLEVRNIAVDNQVAFFDQWAIRKGAYITGKGYNLNDIWIGG